MTEYPITSRLHGTSPSPFGRRRFVSWRRAGIAAGLELLPALALGGIVLGGRGFGQDDTRAATVLIFAMLASGLGWFGIGRWAAGLFILLARLFSAVIVLSVLVVPLACLDRACDPNLLSSWDMYGSFAFGVYVMFPVTSSILLLLRNRPSMLERHLMDDAVRRDEGWTFLEVLGARASRLGLDLALLVVPSLIVALLVRSMW
jgi:hypothetical protein